MADAGAYQNIGTKRLMLARNRLVGTVETVTSGVYLSWQPSMQWIAPGASVMLTAAEAATCGPTLAYMTTLWIQATERLGMQDTVGHWMNPLRMTLVQTIPVSTAVVQWMNPLRFTTITAVQLTDVGSM